MPEFSDFPESGFRTNFPLHEVATAKADNFDAALGFLSLQAETLADGKSVGAAKRLERAVDIAYTLHALEKEQSKAARAIAPGKDASLFLEREEATKAHKGYVTYLALPLFDDPDLTANPGAKFAAAMTLLNTMDDSEPSRLQAPLAKIAVDSFLDPAFSQVSRDRLANAQKLILVAGPEDTDAIVKVGVKALTAPRLKISSGNFRTAAEDFLAFAKDGSQEETTLLGLWKKSLVRDAAEHPEKKKEILDSLDQIVRADDTPSSHKVAANDAHFAVKYPLITRLLDAVKASFSTEPPSLVFQLARQERRNGAAGPDQTPVP